MVWSFGLKFDQPVRKRSTVRKSLWKSFSMIEHPEIEKTSISKAGSIELTEVEETDLIPISKTDAEDRLVRILIQEPSVNVSESDIQKNCYSYMESSKKICHGGEVVNGRARIVENMLAPVDLRINGKRIKKGSWTMALRIYDDELLKDLETGQFKVAGRSIREI